MKKRKQMELEGIKNEKEKIVQLSCVRMYQRKVSVVNTHLCRDSCYSLAPVVDVGAQLKIWEF